MSSISSRAQLCKEKDSCQRAKLVAVLSLALLLDPISPNMITISHSASPFPEVGPPRTNFPPLSEAAAAPTTNHAPPSGVTPFGKGDDIRDDAAGKEFVRREKRDYCEEAGGEGVSLLFLPYFPSFLPVFRTRINFRYIFVQKFCSGISIQASQIPPPQPI